MQGGWAFILVTLAALPALGNVSSNYARIPERNIFALKPPTRPAEPQAPEQKRLPKVALNGITTILGTRQALLKVAPPNAKGADQVESLIMKEGERQGPVEVVQINERQGTVKLVNSGTPMTITFEETPPLDAAPTNAATPQQPRAGPPTAGYRPYTTNGTTNGYAMPSAPAFGARFPIRTRSAAEMAASSYAGTNAPAPLPGSQPTNAQLTPDERAVLMQVQEQLRRESANPQEALPQIGSEQQRVYPAAPQFPPRPAMRGSPYPVMPQ